MGMSERVWHLALCLDCEPVLPQPFTNEAERDKWAQEHTTYTGHTVRSLTEDRS